LILLDEPTAGLDPVARRDLWGHLKELKAARKTTLIVATHLMEEADSCDRIVLLDRGTVAASGTPAQLKSAIGGDILTIESENPQDLGRLIEERFTIKTTQVAELIRIEKEKGHSFIPQLVEAFPGLIRSVSLSKPTLEDAFIHYTGHRFAAEAEKENGK
jgi:ABC-2 type transport system ATP-binding protein